MSFRLKYHGINGNDELAFWMIYCCGILPFQVLPQYRSLEPDYTPWVEKVNDIEEQTKILHIYFNNHYGGKTVVNGMQFKEKVSNVFNRYCD